jgi:hypothetical protein
MDKRMNPPRRLSVVGLRTRRHESRKLDIKAHGTRYTDELLTAVTTDRTAPLT